MNWTQIVAKSRRLANEIITEITKESESANRMTNEVLSVAVKRDDQNKLLSKYRPDAEMMQ